LGSLRAIAISRVSTTGRLSIRSNIDQPTIRRECRSSTADRYSQPSRVGMEVMSAAQARSAAPGSNRRFKTFSATGRSWFESVVRRNLLLALAAIPRSRISFATVITLQRRPATANSAWIRGLP